MRNHSKYKYVYLFFLPFLILGVGLSACSSFFSGIGQRKARHDVCLEGRNIGGMKESQIMEIINEYSRGIDVEPKDAKVDDNTWEIYPEQIGKKVNVEKTLELVLNAAEAENVALQVEEIRPAVTIHDLQKKIVEIASYSTPLLNRSESRINNIEIAAKSINYKKLAPGEEFSFNKTVGRRTQAKGYEEAPIIVQTEDGPEKGFGVGGGVCQLSSTIYNAIEQCGLEVTERHIHSKDVGYVPKGEDATVAYGSVDFRFKNNRSHPVMLRIYLTDKRVSVRVLENRN